ncbi:hypothetical protein [Clostridium kluyveri]|uniref:Uncharacterized protein n=1 Tax=Clostridium kluyveri TaxID=1534 RepID=A0A1L5FCM4_CLOKL|nr:hypothetical protein [Clostridium kluyveri]APM40580.1 hypothetical protein BS101_18560 [Clostridium kluyveri]
MTTSRRIKLSASTPYVNGEEFTMKELGLNEDATNEEIEKALFDILCQNLDWGWSEIEHDQLSKN